MALTIPYAAFAPGATIVSAEHNANNAAIATAVNGNLDTNSLKANAGIVDTQLATISTAGKVSGTAITSGAIAIASLSAVLNTITAGLLIDGAASPVPTGLAAGCIPIPFTGTITNVKVFADKAATAVLDIWMDDFASYPPTVADTITAAAKPTLTAATAVSDSTLTGWTTAVTAGDVLYINVDSNDVATWLTVAITFTRTA